MNKKEKQRSYFYVVFAFFQLVKLLKDEEIC